MNFLPEFLRAASPRKRMAVEIFACAISWWLAFVVLGFWFKGRWEFSPSLLGVGFCGFLGFLSWGWFNRQPNAAPPAPNLGGARFALVAEIAPLRQNTPESLLIGVTTISNEPGDHPLYYAGDSHLLTLAPTRSGKGVGAIVPNLLLADRSALVVDPKGENARITARRRRAFGKVFVLDPFGVAGQPPAAFNPLDALSRDSLDFAEDAATLADALVIDGGEKDSHWNDEAKALLSGLIMYVAAYEKKEHRALGRVREYLTLPPAAFQEFLAEMSGTQAARGLIARTAARFMGKAPAEFSGVVSTAQRHTQFLDSPRIADALARSDFAFSDLVSGVASVFLVLPPDRLEAYNRWLRLMINAALRDLARSPAKPARPILFLLDEFAALGRLEEVRRAVGLMAGYGVQIWTLVQDLSQLQSLYGKSAETFWANAAVIQAFNVRDLETANKLSEFMGDQTISFQVENKTSGETSSGAFGEKSSTSKNTSIVTQHQARRLLKPDEIINMPETSQLLLVKGFRPMAVFKLKYYEMPEFAGLFDG